MAAPIDERTGDTVLGANHVQRHGSAIIALIALLTVVTHVSWRHTRTPSSPPLLDDQSHFARRPKFDSLVIETVVEVPEGSMLLLGSLEQYARNHRVEIEVLSAENKNSTVAAVHQNAMQLSKPNTTCWWDRFLNASLQRSVTTVDNEAALPNRRRFMVPAFHSDIKATTRPTTAQRIATGETCVVYVDESCDSDTSASAGERIVKLMDAGLLSFVEAQVRPILDLDNNERMTFCLTRLSEGQQKDQFIEPIHGCVRAEDFCVAEGPLSPLAGDIVYLDIDLPPGGDLAALLAHELTHAALYSAFADQTVASTKPSTINTIRSISSTNREAATLERPTIPAWLNEGLAHVVERRAYQQSSNLTRRNADFRKSPQATPLVIPDFQPRRFRRGASRAAACSFLEYHLGTRPSLLRKHQRPPSSTSCLEEICGASFETLFQQWAISLIGNIAERHLDTSTVVTLAGTSVCHFGEADGFRKVRIKAPAECECQITVVHTVDRRIANSTVLRESDDQRNRRFSTAGHRRELR